MLQTYMLIGLVSGMFDSYIRDRGTRGILEVIYLFFSLMERWVHTRAFASVLGPRGRASLDAPPHGAKSSRCDAVACTNSNNKV